MISHITKFFLLFLFTILFLSFKNQIKILESDLIYLKKNYSKDSQVYINKEILLTKQINYLQVNDLNDYEQFESKKIIKFDRNEFNDFTIIKITYVQSD